MFDFDKKNKEHDRELKKNITDNQSVYHRVFDGEDGQKVLEDLKKRCFITRTTYDPDPVKMGMNEGRRSICVYITNLLNRELKELLEDVIE